MARRCYAAVGNPQRSTGLGAPFQGAGAPFQGAGGFTTSARVISAPAPAKPISAPECRWRRHRSR
jgi:hypothetical protein